MNLSAYLKLCADRGDLIEITAPVATDQELAAICRREFSKKNSRALLFHHPHPSQFAVAANLFGSEKRMAAVLRSCSLSDFEQKVHAYLHGYGDKCAHGSIATAGVDSRDNGLGLLTEGCELRDIPALKSWPQEQRPYLTLALTITRHPETGQQNMGLYRVQIVGDDRLALNLSPSSGAHRHLLAAAEAGVELPVCLVLGCDPLLMWAAAAPLAAKWDEIAFCRDLFQEDFPLITSPEFSVSVPESAEMVICGSIVPGAAGPEGPFGNHTGSYVKRADCPLMRVEAVYHRPHAVLPFTVVGPPPSENIWLAAANEILIKQLLKQEHDEISGLFMPVTTIFHAVAVITVRRLSAAKVAGLIRALWHHGPLQRARLLIIVDDDIAATQLENCWWRVINRLDNIRLYQDGSRTAIDATGVDMEALVVEDGDIAQLINKRQEEPGYYPF